MTKTAKILGMLGGVLLLATAALHATGYASIAAAIRQSDAPAFLQRAVPGLWMYFSIHLVVLAGAALWASLWGRHSGRALTGFLALAVAVDTTFVFVLAGFFAGVAVLAGATLSLGVAAARWEP